MCGTVLAAKRGGRKDAVGRGWTLAGDCNGVFQGSLASRPWQGTPIVGEMKRSVFSGPARDPRGQSSILNPRSPLRFNQEPRSRLVYCSVGICIVDHEAVSDAQTACPSAKRQARQTCERIKGHSSGTSLPDLEDLRFPGLAAGRSQIERFNCRMTPQCEPEDPLAPSAAVRHSP